MDTCVKLSHCLICFVSNVLSLWVIFFQDASTPTKRKPTVSEAEEACTVNLMPRKKSRTDLPVHDSPRKTSLRLRPLTPVDVSLVRMSPRKTAQPPSSQTRPETPRKGVQKEDGSQVKKKDTTEQLHATKNGSKTQVVYTNLLDLIETSTIETYKQVLCIHRLHWFR